MHKSNHSSNENLNRKRLERLNLLVDHYCRKIEKHQNDEKLVLFYLQKIDKVNPQRLQLFKKAGAN